MPTAKKKSTVYKEPLEYIPKEIQKKYGVGAYAPKKKETKKK